MTHQIEQLVSGSGPLGPLLFIAVYALLTVLFVPGSVSTLAAGAVFGPILGTGLTAIGATLGATAAFMIARKGGRARVRGRGGARIERVDVWLSGRGFLAVLYARLVPAVPFNAFNYAAGLTGISLRDYVAGTAIGILPGTFAFVVLGDALGDPGSPRFVGAVAMVVALAVAAPLIDRAHRRRSGASAEQPGVGDQERDDEVQPTAHPGADARVAGGDHGPLIDEREDHADDQCDPDRAPQVGAPAAERERR